jgi:hypothetical protein
MYTSTCTRPDLAYATSTLSRYNNNPGLKHFAAIKHVFQYLHGTTDYGITYKASANPEDVNLNFHEGLPDEDYRSPQPCRCFAFFQQDWLGVMRLVGDCAVKGRAALDFLCAKDGKGLVGENGRHSLVIEYDSMDNSLPDASFALQSLVRLCRCD